MSFIIMLVGVAGESPILLKGMIMRLLVLIALLSRMIR
jgi:hypothetical protein